MPRHLKSSLAALLASTALLLSGCHKLAQTFSGPPATIVETAYPERVLWGDTHLHTANSVDAFGFGNRLPPEEALRFARGEEVTSSTGIKAKLQRPLDFLVITDHAEGLGATKALYDAPGFLIRDPQLTPFNIGKRIQLNDFTPQEAAPLAQGLVSRKAAKTLEESTNLTVETVPNKSTKSAQADSPKVLDTCQDSALQDRDGPVRERNFAAHSRSRHLQYV